MSLPDIREDEELLAAIDAAFDEDTAGAPSADDELDVEEVAGAANADANEIQPDTADADANPTEGAEDKTDEAPAEDATDGDDTPAEDETDTPVEETDDAPVEDAASDEAPTLTVKVDGADVVLPVEEVVRGYQHAKAANARFEEAAAIRKEAEQAVSFTQTFLQGMDTEPDVVLTRIAAQMKDPRKALDAVLKVVDRAVGTWPELAEHLGYGDNPEAVVAAQRRAMTSERDEARQDAEDKARAETAAAQAPDTHGYTPAENAAFADQILEAAGLTDADQDTQLALIREVVEYRTANAVRNPVTAYVQMVRAQAKPTAEVVEAVAKAASATAAAAVAKPVKPAPGAKRTVGSQKGVAPKKVALGTVSNSRDAATAAVEEYFASLDD